MTQVQKSDNDADMPTADPVSTNLNDSLVAKETSRLDSFLAAKYPAFSRSALSKLCSQGAVLVNGSPATRASIKVRVGDVIQLTQNLQSLNEAAHIDMPILFENDTVIVVDKPAGVLTHSKGVFNAEGTVATFIANKLDPDLAANERGGIVHRLDRDTSGVMICAKTAAAVSYLQKQFSERKVKKTYIAIVDGLIENDEAIVKWPIGRNPKKPQTFRVDANGKPAETQFRVLARNQAKSLTAVELNPRTGRTHQLRVHLQHLGHTIVGDRFYGKAGDRLWLHALSLEITIPGSERKIFTSPLPKEFVEFFEGSIL